MTSGIYQIYNKENEKSYIGSSVNLKKRKIDHVRMLKKSTHPNIHLQRAWNKHGSDSFEFRILVTCPQIYLIKLEQWFLDNTKNLYNIQLKADSSLGRVLSEETKKKIGAKSKLHIHSDETKEKISKSLLGNKRSVGRKLTEEHKNKVYNSDGFKNYMKNKQKPVRQLDKKGNEIAIFKSVTECCKSLDLDQGTVSNICLGKKNYKSYRGFVFEYMGI